jgi:small neutral amino acid transporter SnatA (MarC family)
MKRTTVALIGVPVALAVAVALIYYDLSHSNRPHELRFVPWVGALAALSLWLCGLAASELLRRVREGGPKRTRAVLGLVLAGFGMLPGLALLTLFAIGLFRD